MIYGVVTGLVILAGGTEIVLAHAHDSRSGVAGVLVLAGPMVYVLSQAIYFRVEPAPAGSRGPSEPRSSVSRPQRLTGSRRMP